MLRSRVIPCLLLKNGGLVKTVKFDKPVYVGDPVNAVKIFNEKEVDELVFLDVEATKRGAEPNYHVLREIAGEAFMPLAYGGGIRTLDQVKKLLNLGMEKVVINSAAVADPGLVTAAARYAGSSSVVVSIDYRRGWTGKTVVHTHAGQTSAKISPLDHARRMQEAGAGEIILCAIDRDGTMSGYDLPMIESVASALEIPVVALGGAGRMEHLRQAADAGASAAAGSLFVFHGKHRAVLITYPEYSELKALFS